MLKTIPNLQNYQIDEEGNVYSLTTNKYIKARLNKKLGYMYIDLYPEPQKKKTYRLHRLVAETFIPNPNNLPQVNHKDGNKLNNNVDNLEWCDNGYNQRHAYRLGLKPEQDLHGELNPCAKLTKEDAEYIRKHYKKSDKEYGCAGLGRKFNVSETTIRLVIRNKTWKED